MGAFGRESQSCWEDVWGLFGGGVGGWELWVTGGSLVASGGRFETSGLGGTEWTLGSEGLGTSEGLLERVAHSKTRGVGRLRGPKVFEGNLGTFRGSFYGILKGGDESWEAT